MYIKTLSVSNLNSYIKKIIDNDFILNNACIKGEISNFKYHSSGHMYFSLKDQSGRISCIMFKTSADTMTFMPKDGMNVIVKGKVSIYPRDGVYQIYCNEISPDGLGELYIQYQKLKDKLQKEGLFQDENKKPIPKFPKKIGVITSPTGAAIRDIINVAQRRNPSVSITIYPSLMQGINASAEIIKGINYFNKQIDIDTIILARGGGSIEELWSFNDENIAYTIHNSNKPIITAIGHETDFTIADYVSDKRVATPSAGAEIAIPSMAEINNTIENFKIRLNNNINKTFFKQNETISFYKKQIEILNPINYIVNQYNYIDNLKTRLSFNIDNKMSKQKQLLVKFNALLNAHNPLNILNKGYSLIQDVNNKTISQIEILKKSDIIKVTLKDGSTELNIVGGSHGKKECFL